MQLTGCVQTLPPLNMIPIFLLLLAALNGSDGMNLTFLPQDVQVNVSESVEVQVLFRGEHEELEQVRVQKWTVLYNPPDILTATLSNVSCESYVCNATLVVIGRFLGFGKILLAWKNADDANTSWTKVEQPLLVKVLRQRTILSTLFTAFVATAVSINYINMGCALDLEIVKQVLRKPIGPLVGFLCQSVVMPLVSYGLGFLLFDDPVLRLGLFTFGSSPGGGASNMWTVILGGNLNLSITMTFLSSLLAFGTLPLWLFTLGGKIVEGTNINIPFSNIAISLVSLTIPIGIGVFIQRRYPKLAARSKRILLPLSVVILIAIIVLASIAYTYIFYMLTWRMLLGTCLNVWIGFAAGALISTIFRFSIEDITAVSVETSIQNSGIGFLILTISLKPPVSDLASVVPVAGSIITPFPLMLVYCVQRIRNCCFKTQSFELQPINTIEKDPKKGIENLSMDK